MFQLTHTYVASKVVGDQPYVLFGAILPDISFLDDTNYLEDDHANVDDWIDTIEDAELKWGIITHRAVDEISHNGYSWDGPDKSFSQWCRTNFPKYKNSQTLHLATEYLVELYVARNYPEIIKTLDFAMKQVDVYWLSENLAPVLNENETKLTKKFKQYIGLVRTNSRIAEKMNFIAKNTDREACLELCIKKCQNAIASWEDLKS